MPFLQEGGSAAPLSKIGSGLPPATLIVQPDKVLALKHDFEQELGKVHQFITQKGHLLATIPPPGADPCSEGTVEALGQNGQSALDAATGYVRELTNIINSLDEIARAYGLLEETGADRFKR
jgi:PE family protein